MSYRSIGESQEDYRARTNSNDSTTTNSTTVAGSEPESESEEQEQTLEDEYGELSDEELVDKWEFACQESWKTHKEVAEEEMADRNISPKFGDYAEMDEDEITRHKSFRKRWL